MQSSRPLGDTKTLRSVLPGFMTDTLGKIVMLCPTGTRYNAPPVAHGHVTRAQSAMCCDGTCTNTTYAIFELLPTEVGRRECTHISLPASARRPRRRRPCPRSSALKHIPPEVLAHKEGPLGRLGRLAPRGEQLLALVAGPAPVRHLGESRNQLRRGWEGGE